MFAFHFMSDPGGKTVWNWIREEKMAGPGSGIKHPGSATLVKS
jgi:hypothetical protein